MTSTARESTVGNPAAYLHAIIETSEPRAKTLRDTLSKTENQGLYRKVDEYVDDLLENADHALNNLEDTDFGTFDVLSPAVDYNYDRKMHDVRRLGMKYEDSLTEEERSAFRNPLEALTTYGSSASTSRWDRSCLVNRLPDRTRTTQVVHEVGEGAGGQTPRTLLRGGRSP